MSVARRYTAATAYDGARVVVMAECACEVFNYPMYAWYVCGFLRLRHGFSHVATYLLLGGTSAYVSSCLPKCVLVLFVFACGRAGLFSVRRPLQLFLLFNLQFFLIPLPSVRGLIVLFGRPRRNLPNPSDSLILIVTTVKLIMTK
jgi:hypothetical protein